MRALLCIPSFRVRRECGSRRRSRYFARGSDGARDRIRDGYRRRRGGAPGVEGRSLASSRSWYVWRGVAGQYYARVPRTSPPRVVRARNTGRPAPGDHPGRADAPDGQRSVTFQGLLRVTPRPALLSLRSLALIMKRLLDPSSLRALARGCAVLGAGGGGDTYIGVLQALQATEDYGPVPLVDLDELPDDALIMPCGGIGAPTVSIEKIENGDEGARLRDHLERLTGAPGRRADGRRDRRRQRPAADHLGGADGPAGGGRRRHGPRLPRGAPGHHAPGRDLARARR